METITTRSLLMKSQTRGHEPAHSSPQHHLHTTIFITVQDSGNAPQTMSLPTSSTMSVASSFDTQTLIFRQEPFEDFQHKVHKFCGEIWTEAGHIQVERIAGGTVNRTTAITAFAPVKGRNTFRQALKYLYKTVSRFGRWKEPKDSHPQEAYIEYGEYILRMPRRTEDMEPLELDNQEASLMFAATQTGFRVPEVLRINHGSDNVLEGPYAIQVCIPGKPLDEVWKKLSHGQRLSAARQVGQMLKQLTTHKYDATGTVDPRNFKDILALTDPGEEKNTILLAEPMNPRALMKDLLLKGEGAQVGGEYLPFAAIAGVIGEDTLGPDPHYYFTHGDFYPRNIMVETVDESTVKITGVIDWDTAEFAPAIVAFESPFWLWRFDEYLAETLEDPMLHVGAADKPADPLDQEIKHAFEEMVGEEWLKISYFENAELWRWAWLWAKEGLWHHVNLDMAFEAQKELVPEVEEEDGDSSEAESDSEDENSDESDEDNDREEDVAGEGEGDHDNRRE